MSELVEHPNARVVRSLMEALSTQDRAAIEQILHADCVWRVPGDNGLAGTYQGRPAILGMFRLMKRLFTGPAAFEVIEIATTAERVLTYQYGIVVIAGQTVRFKECLVYRVEDGQVVEVDEFQFDQAGFDRVFSHAVVDSVGER